MQVAETVIILLQIYTAIGAVLALIFLMIGIDRIDPDARGSYAFRPVLLPGLVILWPVVLLRWLELEKTQRVASGGSGQPNTGGSDA